MERQQGAFYDANHAEKTWGSCCDDCNDVYFEKTYPMHTAYLACTNLKCKCHLPPTT